MTATTIGVLIASTLGMLSIAEKIWKGYSNLKKRRASKLANKGKFYGGNWNNQGQIINRPTHYIDMDGYSDGNKLSSNFNVRRSDNENSWEMFGLISKRRYRILKCEVFRIKEGAKILVARGILRKDPEGLRWILQEGSTVLFPQEALLRRGLPKIE